MQISWSGMGRWGSALLALLLWVSHVDGGELQPAARTLTVSATGKLWVPPDRAMVNVSVEISGESLHRVQETNAKRIQHVMTRLRQLGIEEEQIHTSAFQVIPLYPNQQFSHQRDHEQLPKIIGYTVRHTLAVEVRDLNQVGRLVDEALDAGANRFDGLTWGLRNEHHVYLQALTLAARKAKEKAEALARALDVRFVRIRQVTESQGRSIWQPSNVAPVMRAGVQEESGSVPVAPGELKVQATVTLMCEIDQE